MPPRACASSASPRTSASTARSSYPSWTRPRTGPGWRRSGARSCDGAARARAPARAAPRGARPTARRSWPAWPRPAARSPRAWTWPPSWSASAPRSRSMPRRSIATACSWASRWTTGASLRRPRTSACAPPAVWPRSGCPRTTCSRACAEPARGGAPRSVGQQPLRGGPYLLEDGGAVPGRVEEVRLRLVEDDVRPQTDLAPRRTLEGHLHEQSLHRPRRPGLVEDEVAQGVPDQRAVDRLHARRPVGVVADDEGRARLRPGGRQLALRGRGGGPVLDPPMGVDDDHVSGLAGRLDVGHERLRVASARADRIAARPVAGGDGGAAGDRNGPAAGLQD